MCLSSYATITNYIYLFLDTYIYLNYKLHTYIYIRNSTLGKGSHSLLMFFKNMKPSQLTLQPKT